MKRTLKNEAGFTLIELILVIAILGILAVAVAPSFTNLLSSASTTGGRGTGGAIQSGINTVYSENVLNDVTPAWPATLDSASNAECSTSNPCFGGVVQEITGGGWTRSSDTEYAYSNAGVSQTWTYDTTTGKFSCTAGDC